MAVTVQYVEDLSRKLISLTTENNKLKEARAAGIFRQDATRRTIVTYKNVSYPLDNLNSRISSNDKKILEYQVSLNQAAVQIQNQQFNNLARAQPATRSVQPKSNSLLKTAGILAAADLGVGLVSKILKKPDGTSVLPFNSQSILGLGTVSNITNLGVSRATDFLKNGNTSTISDPTKSSSSAKKNLPNLVPNPMEQFASYSCLWTLACLTPDQFNNPASYRSSPQALNNIVFSSGGRYDNQRVKTFFGSPEYFVNNFQMNCIIGTNEKTGNTNAFKFSFDIAEPHSMGLLLQSMQNAAVKAGYLSYLDNAPYVLRMDIQGYDELGRVIKTIKPKFFTLKLVSIKFSVNEGGSLYKVEAIPYNHQGFSDAVNVVYTDIKISGDLKGTGIVSEVLATSKDSLAAVLNRNEDKLKVENRIAEPDQYAVQFPTLASEWKSSAGTPPTSKNATVDPLAVATESVVKVSGGAARPQDTINQLINELGTASLGFDALPGGNILFKRADDQIDAKTGVIKRDGMTIDPKARAFQFGQGQSLTSMINQVILSSDYAKKAILDKNQGGFGTTPEGYIKWFKLDVQIELLKLDPITGDYAKKITYRVVPYYIHQSIFSNPNSAPVGYSELMKTVVKEYQYIYSGQNVDVLKFDININNLFFAGVNPSPENQGSKTDNQDQKLSEQKNKTAKAGQGQAAAAQAAQMGRARPDRDRALLKAFKGGSGTKSTEQNIAESFQQAFISGNSADLVTVDLEIMGDPYWIVDSGIGNYFASSPSPISQITNDGTMNYESGNVYIYLTFKTPADINETTGLYDFSVAGKDSPFSGIYRVNICENTFSDGQWKQKLKCLRMPGPQGPEAEKTAQGDQPTVISTTGNSAIEVGPEDPAKTSPTDDPNLNSAPSTNASGSQAAGSAASAQTVNTSTAGPRRVGFRYYRDLGQN